MQSTMWVTTSMLLASAGWAAPATVEQVVVFSDRAEVTRRASARCQDDVAAVAFAGLPAELDERTLRAEASGKAQALGVSSRVVPRKAPEILAWIKP